MTLRKDLTGQRFGKLTVLYVLPHNKGEKIKWHCKCDCGNECDVTSSNLCSGHTQSCGCNWKKYTQFKDLTGQKFGKLTVLNKTEKKSSNGGIIWHCKCDCGNECDVSSHNLLSGHTKSCGCHKYEYKDISNQRFGKLVALYPTGKVLNHSGMIWHCRCDCGNECDVPVDPLIRGATQSCGCLKKSHGALKIENILKDNNIKYISEKSFEDCRFSNTNALARFDFYLPEKNILIEFDGIQHFQSIKHFKGEEGFKVRQEYDRYKNQYALEHGYILIRIPYFDEDKINIDMLLGKNPDYIVTSVD